MLTQSQLKRLWHYCPETGLFTRLVKTRYGLEVGSVATVKNDQGYIIITIARKHYRAHRLAHLYMAGEWPKHQIDHEFGICDDNRWCNLRDVTQSVNMQNQRNPHRDNKSGYQGVCWSKEKFKWMARISVNNKDIFLGYFDCKHQAGAYRLQKKRELHEGCTI